MSKNIFILENSTKISKQNVTNIGNTSISNGMTSDLIENQYLRYVISSFMILLIIFAVIGNICIIRYVTSHQTFKRKATGFLIVNLAICDLVLSGVDQPMALLDLLLPFDPEHRAILQGRIYCQISGFILSLLQAVGFHTIVAISLERFVLICYPLKAKQWLTVKKCVTLIILIWMISFGMVIPVSVVFAFEETAEVKGANITFCVLLGNSANLPGKIYYTVLFFVYYALPVIIVSISYGRIFYILHSNIPGNQIVDKQVQKTTRTRRRLAKKMVLIAVVFTLCHGPYWFTILFLVHGGQIKDNPLFTMMILEILPLLSSALNPVIYSGNLCSPKRRANRMFSFLSRTRSGSNRESFSFKKRKSDRMYKEQRESLQGSGSNGQHALDTNAIIPIQGDII